MSESHFMGIYPIANVNGDISLKTIMVDLVMAQQEKSGITRVTMINPLRHLAAFTPSTLLYLVPALSAPALITPGPLVQIAFTPE